MEEKKSEIFSLPFHKHRVKSDFSCSRKIRDGLKTLFLMHSVGKVLHHFKAMIRGTKQRHFWIEDHMHWHARKQGGKAPLIQKGSHKQVIL
jgi:hypothetical protein